MNIFHFQSHSLIEYALNEVHLQMEFISVMSISNPPSTLSLGKKSGSNWIDFFSLFHIRACKNGQFLWTFTWTPEWYRVRYIRWFTEHGLQHSITMMRTQSIALFSCGRWQYWKLEFFFATEMSHLVGISITHTQKSCIIIHSYTWWSRWCAPRKRQKYWNKKNFF